ncbi:hypothetical protein [Clostridium saccharoperbutylacetonicum]|uniref:hypothetical protein n=1 Tax=Clostridium saccharoperbutylacetonicum TaxID=36745 RepID=UPI0039E9B756
MGKYHVTVTSEEYNPKKHEWETREFKGTYNAESEEKAEIQARELYAFELDTEQEDIKVSNIVEIKDHVSQFRY